MNKSFTVDEIKKKLEYYCAYQDRCHQEVEKKLKEFRLIPEARELILIHLIQTVDNSNVIILIKHDLNITIVEASIHYLSKQHSPITSSSSHYRSILVPIQFHHTPLQ